MIMLPSATQKTSEDLVKLKDASELLPLSPVSFSTTVDFPVPTSPKRTTYGVRTRSISVDVPENIGFQDFVCNKAG
jgi:hypothetical protein